MGFSQPTYPHAYPTPSSGTHQSSGETPSPAFQHQIFGSTQSSHLDDNPTPTLDKKKKGKKVASSKAIITKTKVVHWDADDEVLLARAHVHISVDSITGNNQKVDDFWKRIHAYWIKEALVPREQSVIKSHWHQMAKPVHRFAELYNNLKDQYHSGWSDDQIRNAAKTKYFQSEKAKFPYEHVWEVVRFQPKWNMPAPLHTKRTKTSASGEYSTSASDGHTTPFDLNAESNPITVEEYDVNLEDAHEHYQEPTRPIGTKKAKALTKAAKRKEKSNETDESLEEMFRLKATMLKQHQQKMDDFIFNQDMNILFADRSHMDPKRLAIHKKVCDKIMAKHGLDDVDLNE
ncbi:hypothetical protein E3N88_06008 [Mikania micrantha]|uniref:No apical meristem-associated C-terminal domain-containing protein n=1 Tax=Mikania micrantha TaxID=192012 RepID=A0A5N6PNF1_9ASTR|nr:hypothetical protein E3N88_06008 [Mikania micrantha]